jgi:hypothetical protein
MSRGSFNHLTGPNLTIQHSGLDKCLRSINDEISSNAVGRLSYQYINGRGPFRPAVSHQLQLHCGAAQFRASPSRLFSGTITIQRFETPVFIFLTETEFRDLFNGSELLQKVLLRSHGIEDHGRDRTRIAKLEMH